MGVGVFVRQIRADKLLIENIRTLLHHRGIDQQSLARWCGHEPAWINKILKGERGLQMKELGCVADFFGLRADQLLSPGISPLLERRRAQRRSARDRRSGIERRQGRPEGSVHPDVLARFREPLSREDDRPSRIARGNIR